MIVPAHNEESCIREVALSLLAQDYPEHAVSWIFALDRCTDGTRRVLESALAEAPPGRRARCSILEIDACPPDFAGKSHALWRAVHDAPAAQSADLLAFIDADTTLAPDCLRLSVDLLSRRGLALLSLLSTLTNKEPFERIAQPAATLELVRQFPILRANSLDGRPARRPFANGQFILVRHDAYLAFGGHEARRAEVLEDVELARQAARFNHPTGVFIADGLISCRMYQRYDEFVHGWKRIFRESCNNRPGRMRRAALRTVVLGAVLPALCLLAVLLGVAQFTPLLTPADEAGRWLRVALVAAGSLGLIAFYSILLVAYRIGHTGALWALAYPVGAVQVAGILRAAAREQEAGVPIRWGGREYHRPTR